MRRAPRLSDDALAALTDRILDGREDPTGNSREKMEGPGLENTVRLLGKQARSIPPSQEMTRRIQARLTSEWRKGGPGERETRQARKKNQQILILGFATIAAVVAFSAIFLLPEPSQNLQGSAVELSPATIIAGISIMTLGFVVWIIIHNSRRSKK